MSNDYFLRHKSIKASAGTAWFYANDKNIEIHIDAPGGLHNVLTIPRRTLADYIQRTEPRKR